jgi:hypothetical protein
VKTRTSRLAEVAAWRTAVLPPPSWDNAGTATINAVTESSNRFMQQIPLP